MIDGQPGDVFAEVRGESLVWAGNGERVAYVARSPDGWHAVVDGRRSRPYAEFGTGIAFSPDGSRYGFCGSRDQAAYVVIDGQEHGPYGEGRTEPPLFSPDGKRVFYTNWAAGRGFLMCDGRKEQDAGPYGFVTHQGAVFSADSRRLAYIMDDTKAGTRHVVFDGVATRGYHANGVGPLALSTDGSHQAFAYQAMMPGDQPGDYRLVVDGKEGQPLGGTPVSLVFSPDGKRVAARVQSRSTSEEWVVLDGVAGKRYMRVIPDEPLFSPDGRTCVYVGWNHVGPWKLQERGNRDDFDPDAESFVVINGAQTAKWVRVGRPIFLPDGRLTYGAVDTKGNSFLVIDMISYPAPFMSTLVVKDKVTLQGLSGHVMGPRDWEVVRVEVSINP